MQELTSIAAEEGVGGEEEEELVENEVEVVETTWMMTGGNKEELEGGGGDGSIQLEPSVITESSSSQSAYVVDLTPQFDRVFVQNAFNSFRGELVSWLDIQYVYCTCIFLCTGYVGYVCMYGYIFALEIDMDIFFLKIICSGNFFPEYYE